MKNRFPINVAVFLIFLSLYGCANRNIPLPEFTFRSTHNGITINSVSIIDRSIKEKVLNESVLGNYQYPILQDVPFVNILSNDIKAFFNTSAMSEYSLTVIIQRAIPYGTLTVAKRIPFLGLLAMGMDVEYGVYLQMRVEVQQNNKVVRVYIYDNVIKTIGNNDTAGYQRLISVYREEFFNQVDREFVARYF